VTAKKKPTPAPAGPVHDCGHELWLHSKKVNGDPWRCHEPGCECQTKELKAA
jgi:hypothetical protein